MMRGLGWIVAAAAVVWVGCASDGASTTPPPQASLDFTHPAECASCHPRQYEEWQGAMMAYASVSPVFNALEAAANQLTDGAFAADGSQPLFCQRCHSPVSVQLGEFPPYADMEGRPSRDFTSEIGSHGLSCDFCHQISHANLAGSLLGDGVGNSAYAFGSGDRKYGPFAAPVSNAYHAAEQDDFLRSAGFCGTCHDVRPFGQDLVTGEPFLRLENAFTEWQSGPYATSDNPYGKVVTCQDCHMSAYPYAAPGTYFQDRAAALADVPTRPVVTHYFTGVDMALIDFPGQDDSGLDSHGVPIGQAQRRADLLRAACALELDVPDSAAPGAVVPIRIGVTNKGAGHNVPTGFSQERQVWIELTVTDAEGALVYRSGYLIDGPHPETGEDTPDGSLEDEDLQNLIGLIDPISMEATVVAGPDENQRPERNLGLVNFGNEFKRMDTSGGAEEVFVPFLANHMDNSHSIPPLETAWNQYDVEVPASAVGPLQIEVRLRFRTFPPRFLRMLARARPDLVDEALVDRNKIVDMAETSGEIPLTEATQP